MEVAGFEPAHFYFYKPIQTIHNDNGVKVMSDLSKLNYSRPFDRWRVSDHPEVKKVVGIVSGKLFKSQASQKTKDHLVMVILELLVANKTDPKLYIAISRDRNRYSGATRYKALRMNYESTITVLDTLYLKGFIEHHKGFYDAVGRMTRIKAKPKLVKLFNKHQIVTGMLKVNRDRKVLVIKDHDGEEISFTDTATTKLYVEHIERFNSLIDETRN